MHPDGFSGTAFVTITLCVLLFAACKAVSSRDGAKAFWSAFAIAGIVYFLLTAVAQDEYLTTKLLELIRQRYGEVMFAPPNEWDTGRVYRFYRVGEAICSLLVGIVAGLIAAVMYRRQQVGRTPN